ncbi:MAG: mechanosensitive ion channel family protein [Treponema sp.]|nr:mechanosensitive ion channel family protein [Treponema sp.]
MNETADTTQSVAEAAHHVVVESTNTFLVWLKSFLTWGNLFKLISALVVLLILWIVYRLIMRAMRKMHHDKMSPQRYMLVTKIFNYAFYIIVVMYVLSMFGVKLSAVWGAAGIAGIALGFAAQTSVSNLISGVFVLGEGIMKVGDFITVGNETGTVDSVDLLSVKIHTPNNQLVRVPNSSIINSNLTNTSFFPQRRLTIAVSVSYDTDMQTALDTLKKAPALCPTVLTDPAPAAWFDGFGESGINLTLAVWFNKTDFLAAKNETFIAIKKVFDEAHISIPRNKLFAAIESSGEIS